MPRKKPMAQATFSWPFGPIHLERHQGMSAIGRCVCAAPASMPLPPGPPFYGGPNQADLAVIAKARVAQLIAFPSSFAAAHWAGNEGIVLPWLKAPLFAVGLKCGSGGRRILRRFPISVGAAHWAARGFRALHTFLQPCRGEPRGRPSEPYRFSTNFPGLGRGGPWASRCSMETGRPSVPPLRAGVGSPRRATARVAPTVLRGHV